MKRGQWFWIATALVVTTLASAGCRSGQRTAAGSSTGSGLSSQARAAIATAYQGSFGAPPASSLKPEPGKNIWLVTLSASFGAPGELAAAAGLMGWHVTVFDGKFTPDVEVDGLRQAIADKADAVIVAYADCATIKAGLQDVRKAGIPVVNIESSDCDQQIGADGVVGNTGQPGLFDSGVGYYNPADPGRPLTFAEFWQIFARYQALGIIDGTNGRAKIIALSETDLRLNFVSLRIFKATLRALCPGCQIVDTVDFVGSDLGPGLQQKVAQAVVQHPEANAVYGIYDAPTRDVATAVIGSGRRNDIFVMGGEGTAPVADLIREDRGVNAGVGFLGGLGVLRRVGRDQPPAARPEALRCRLPVRHRGTAVHQDSQPAAQRPALHRAGRLCARVPSRLGRRARLTRRSSDSLTESAACWYKATPQCTDGASTGGYFDNLTLLQ
jgi:ribose transport system substrate-binding protein